MTFISTSLLPGAVMKIGRCCRRRVQCVRQRFAPNRAAGNTMNITSSRRPRDRFVIRCATTNNLTHRCASLHRLGHYCELLYFVVKHWTPFRKCRQDLLAHDASIETKVYPSWPGVAHELYLQDLYNSKAISQLERVGFGGTWDR